MARLLFVLGAAGWWAIAATQGFHMPVPWAAGSTVALLLSLGGLSVLLVPLKPEPTSQLSTVKR